MEDRKEGYYWVKRNGKWMVAYWSVPIVPTWILFFETTMFLDDAFEEIDEKMIER